MLFTKTGITEAELKSIELFKYVGLESIIGLLDACSTREAATGEVLISPGKRNDTVYIILRGKLSVHLDSPEAAPLVVMGPGECVGEISVIDRQQTSAYVVAQEPCCLLTMDEDILWSLVQYSHAAACNLLYILTKRLRHTDAIMAEYTELEDPNRHFGTVDALTGLYNRHWLDMALKRYIQRYSTNEKREVFSILMIDIDHFKKFNDHHGHPYGDRVLYWVAHTISLHLRPSEVVTRYGGDEFVILLPDIDTQKARDIAQRLHDAVGNPPLMKDEKQYPHPTLSIGIAQLEPNQTLEMLLAEADAALYRAKSNGRNCTST